MLIFGGVVFFLDYYSFTHQDQVVVSNIFFKFSPRKLENIPILTIIFFRWVGSTTNQKKNGRYVFLYSKSQIGPVFLEMRGRGERCLAIQIHPRNRTEMQQMMVWKMYLLSSVATLSASSNQVKFQRRTVDGSEIPNNHLTRMKACKEWDLNYQTSAGELIPNFFHPSRVWDDAIFLVSPRERLVTFQTLMDSFRKCGKVQAFVGNKALESSSN